MSSCIAGQCEFNKFLTLNSSHSSPRFAAPLPAKIPGTLQFLYFSFFWKKIPRGLPTEKSWHFDTCFQTKIMRISAVWT